MRLLESLVRIITTASLSLIWAGSVTAPVVQADTSALAAARVSVVSTSAVHPVSPAAKAAQAATAVTFVPAGLAAGTPVIAQGDLLGGYGCAPTSAAMVFGYFHAVNPAYASTTPQALVGPNDFVPGQGVPYNNMIDSMSALGYRHLSGHQGASLEELIGGLGSGPVIASVGVSLAGNTLVAGPVSHSIVVIGVATDRSAVLVNDPWTGRQLKLTIASFNAIWARGNRGIALLRP